MENNTPYPTNAGIYKLTCIENKKIYIGKSFNIRQRLNRHKLDSIKLKNGGYFQRAIIKHGWDAFVVEILEIMENFDKFKDGPKLLEKEAYYIKLFNSTDEHIGYNICEYSTDRIGIKHSEETKLKMSLAALGKKVSEETKKKFRNRIYSIETREKMRQAKLGKSLSKEHKEKISKSNMGKMMSSESKAKLSRSKLGKPFSEEHKRNMRESRKGRTLSEEHKKKIGLSRLGKRMPEEVKEKIRNTTTGKPKSKKILIEDINNNT